MTKAGDMPNEDLAGAERVTVRAPEGRAGDPLVVRRPYQLA
jgi:hypothetical protein